MSKVIDCKHKDVEIFYDADGKVASIELKDKFNLLDVVGYYKDYETIGDRLKQFDIEFEKVGTWDSNSMVAITDYKGTSSRILKALNINENTKSTGLLFVSNTCIFLINLKILEEELDEC